MHEFVVMETSFNPSASTVLGADERAWVRVGSQWWRQVTCRVCRGAKDIPRNHKYLAYYNRVVKSPGGKLHIALPGEVDVESWMGGRTWCGATVWSKWDWVT